MSELAHLYAAFWKKQADGQWTCIVDSDLLAAP